MQPQFYPLRYFILLLLGLSFLSPAGAQTGGGGERPNILVIMADDLGYGDVGFNRAADYPADLGIIPTPRLDALAAAGIVATNAHVAHPFCGPSRAAILSGVYPHRIGAQYNLPNDITTPLGIPESETYFSRLIDQASYHTMAVGKWHLGFAQGQYQPQDRGFDEFFGFLGGGKSYFRSAYDQVWYKYRPTDPEYNDPARYNEPKDNHTTNEYQDPLRRNRDYVDRKEFGLEEYLTDVLTDQAIDFIDRKASEDDPFFLYLAYNAPHTPLQAPEEEIAAFKAANPDFEELVRNSPYLRESPPVTQLPAAEQAAMIEELVRERIVYATMVANMDANIGRVVDKLRATGELDNTLIIFLSDNGGYRWTKGAVNYPLDDQKGSVDEGGHRVPFFVHWPARITTPATYDYTLSALDLYPTLVKAAGGEIPAGKRLDGVDFLDALIAGRDARPGEPIYVLRPQDGFHNAAVVSYPYRMTKKGGNGPWRLFDGQVNPEVELTGAVGSTTAEAVKFQLERQGAEWSRDFYDVKPSWFDHDRNGGHPHRILWYGEDLAGNTAEPVFADYERTFDYASHKAGDGAVYPHTDPLNLKAWTLNEALSDEFEGDTLDENKWLIQGRDGEYRSNFVGRAPWQYSTDNVRLEDGMLKIQTRYEPDREWVNPGTDEYRWTTGGISTKETLFEGYMEIKCRLPVEFVTGAFWTTGAKGVLSELDVFEAVGKGRRQNLMWSTIHDWTIPNPNKVWTETHELPFSFSDGFHVFGAEWGSDTVRLYADGQLIASTSRQWVEENGIDSKRWPLVGGQHIWVDSEIFPWWGEPDPANLPVDYEVEYVRVWEREEPNPNTGRVYDFEGPVELQDGSYEDWFIPGFAQDYYAITTEKPFSGQRSLRFTHSGALTSNAVAFAPFGSLNLEAGSQVMTARIWVAEGSTRTLIRPILEDPWVELPGIDISGLPTNTWTTVTLPFTRELPSGEKDRLRLLLRPGDTDADSSTVYIDDIRFSVYRPVAGLTIAPDSARIEVGQSVTLVAEVKPADATRPQIYWTSNDTTVATVDAAGTVLGVGPGTTVITATTEEGGFTATAAVEVTPYVPLTTVYDFEGPIQLGDGTSQDWFIPAFAQANYRLTNERAYAGNKSLKFTHAGTLGNNGVAFAPFGTLKLGTGIHNLRLRVWVEAGSSQTLFRPILEEPFQELTSLEITELPTGQWVTVDIPFTRDANSGPKDRLRLLVRPTDTDAGSSTVYFDEIEISAGTPWVAITGVGVFPDSLQLTVGDTTRLTTTVAPADASDPTVTYASLDPGVATVDTAGLVHAVAAGYTAVVATTADGGLTDTVEVTVLNPVPLGQHIWLQAHSGYYLRLSQQAKVIEANAAQPEDAETFKVVDAGEGYIALRATSHDKILQVFKQDANIFKANSRQITQDERLSWEPQAPYRVSFRTQANDLYATVDPRHTDLRLRANADAVGDWEIFNWGFVDAQATAGAGKPATIATAAPSLQVAVYPNPLRKNELTVALSGTGVHELTISTLAGQRVYVASVEGGDRLIIDTGRFSAGSGVYLIRVDSPAGSVVRKLVIAR
ncbi:arylsulfatase A-like enzyme/uncharacterized protein YjdB/beta-glucanase (GH16 family) [Lewinella marina]|nr:sulfatase-like hydrolase/transferase [Neolewinella marina]NJB85951.1 arylsulfatase A-like enzyme/uncharacterized protein YjdB/beta-glucanase (GH16 family) [Neolewinella marina]